MSAGSVRVPACDDEVARLGEIAAWAFGVPPADSTDWLRRGGIENLRVAVSDGRVQGGLLFIPMGQWFGGRSVPTTGIAGVAVAPEARGRGVAKQLMAAAVGELASAGVALSTLYPATVPLYRSVGYELAGGRYSVQCRLDALGVCDRTLAVRELTEADAPAVEAVYRERAAENDGYLDRGSYLWNRVRAPRNEKARGFVVERDGRLEGYAYLREKASGLAYDLSLTDLVATTRDAARRLLTFLADHRSLGERATWYSSPADPLVLEQPERGAEVRLAHHWMLRVADPVAALRGRGYLPGLSAELDLEVHDELGPGPRRLRLVVRDGASDVEAGGTGALSLDVRGLAALYSGFVAPRDLVMLGLARGSRDSLRRAAAVFAGPPPSMPDMF
jgi:predicted acetyltransferase